jgi:uroporphyrinogen decarboxylase
MTKAMTSRERVLTALHHQEPDRVPMALWGSYYTLHDQTYFNLLKHLGLVDPVPPLRRYMAHNGNYLDDRVLDRLGTDIRYVWLGFTDLSSARPDTMVDAWGVEWKRMPPNIYAVGQPLAGASIKDVEAYPYPDPERYIRLDELRNRLALLKKTRTHAIAARAVNSYGPFEQASLMRGREQFLVDLLLNPELAQLLVCRITDVIVRLTEIYLDVAGKDIDIIEIPGDDYGGSDNLLFSPQVFDKILKPALERIIRPIKEYRKDLFVAFHSDGAIMKLLGRFTDLGIDLFHPLEPLPANDMDAIKAQFGGLLSFMGAIDVRKAMPGSIADVEAEVKRCIHILAPGGGYILAPANHVQTDVPPENVVALYRFGQRYGCYPLN